MPVTHCGGITAGNASVVLVTLKSNILLLLVT
jgi:hypothetical protein